MSLIIASCVQIVRRPMLVFSSMRDLSVGSRLVGRIRLFAVGASDWRRRLNGELARRWHCPRCVVAMPFSLQGIDDLQRWVAPLFD
jgi:hypothetical protein